MSSNKRVFDNKRKLELVLTIDKLQNFSKEEVAKFFGTSRQIINYHKRKADK